MFSALWPSLIWILIINAVMTAWVYSDAKDRDHPDPAEWAVIVLLLGVIGLIVYLLKRPVKRHESTEPIEAKPPLKRRGVPHAIVAGLKIFGVVWIGSLVAIGIAYVLRDLGQIGAASFVMMVSTGTLVLSTMIFFALAIAFVILALLRR
jgi:hypothetical protein